MENTLQSFEKELDELRHYIQGLELESRLISSEVDKKSQTECESLVSEYQKYILAARKKKQQFEYNSIIVSLYGFLEQFVESLIESYLKQLNVIIPVYSALPEAITKNYIDISVEFMKYIEESKYKEKEFVTKKQLISDLYSCISNSAGYRINPYPFIHHTANFWPDVIASSFASVGVRNVSGRVIKCPVFTRYLKEKDPASVDHTEPNLALSDLNHLIERRNKVAHGEPPVQLLDNITILENYIPLFEAYGKALYEVVYSEVLKYEVKYNGTELGSPIKIFKQGKVVGISVKETTIKVGDLLVAKTANDILPYIAGKIMELQVENVSYREVPASLAGVDIGISVPFRAKENHTFFLVRKTNKRNAVS
ncbi:MAE_28990/MAE_18760 family HEPN-like nuclease [Desulfobacterales bacterium HSG2]|nr:MAE_28990/MAE_18760 family HEPN-like nuclease [Desulfobacterales bacterium HSG2]